MRKRLPILRLSGASASASYEGQPSPLLVKFYLMPSLSYWRQPTVALKSEGWGERWGSNPRPSEPQPDALPTELLSPYNSVKRCHYYTEFRVKCKRFCNNPVIKYYNSFINRVFTLVSFDKLRTSGF